MFSEAKVSQIYCMTNDFARNLRCSRKIYGRRQETDASQQA